MAGVVLVAFGMRVFGLWELPPGLGWDEAYYAKDAASVLNGVFLPFYPDNFGREGLFIIAAAPFVAIFGHDPMAVRLPAAFFGVLSVAAIFPLGRRLFRRALPAKADSIALAAAMLAAASLWMVASNRIGWRANIFPFLLAAAGYWFWRAFEDRRPRDWAWAGFTFGLMQYTYSAGRALPPIIPGFAILWLLVQGDIAGIFRRWREWTVFGIAMVAVLLPLLFYAALYPADFFSRQTRLAEVTVQNAALPEKEHYIDRFIGTVGVFIVHGDDHPPHNVAGRPAFDLFIAPFFLLGLGLMLFRWRKPVYSFVLFWLAVHLVLVSILRDAVPHYVHLAGMLPVMFFVPGLGLVEAAGWLSRRTIRQAGAALAGVLLLATTINTAHGYFVEYAAQPTLPAELEHDLIEIAKMMNARGNDPDTAFLLPLSPLVKAGYFHIVLEFLYTGQAPFHYVRVDEKTIQPILSQSIGDKHTIIEILRNRDRMTAPDEKDVIDSLLRRAGDQVDDIATPYYQAKIYKLTTPLPTDPAPDQTISPALDFGDALDLQTASYGVSLNGTRLWTETTWRLNTPQSSDMKASLRLRDQAGRLLALTDRQLLRAPRYEPTSQWKPGDTQRAYHVLEIPPGTPPDRYTLHALVYDAATGKLLPVAGKAEGLIGTVDLTTPAIGAQPPGDLAIPAVQAGPLSLVGVQVPDDPQRPGDNVPLVLYWRSAIIAPDAGNGYTVQAIGPDGEQHAVWTGLPLAGQYPAARWQANELIRDLVDLRLDPEAPGGTYRLVMRWSGTQAVPIGEIEVTGRQRRYDVPAGLEPADSAFGAFAKLAGWALTPGSGGRCLNLTLAWQSAGQTPRDWTVFVHVVDRTGKQVAGADGPPAGGAAPASSWLPGEVIVDQRLLDAPGPGPLSLVVGLYDPLTGERVPIGDGTALTLGEIPAGMLCNGR